jgi:phosphoribosylpyrophosphate synthetase
MSDLAELLKAKDASIDADDDFDAINRLYMERGWGDGLPIIPPTTERVEAMLAYCDRPWNEPIAKMAPRYGEATRGADIQWRVTPPKEIPGRTVLVLDDILDGGDTMAAIRDRLLAGGAKAFFSAVLVEKVLARTKPIAADFIGMKIEDRFVFGCGMDAKGYWRNLPEIRAMKGS